MNNLLQIRRAMRGTSAGAAFDCLCFGSCLFRVAQAQPNGPSLTIDLKSAIAPVSPMHYGLMTEEINHSYDGGLYAELVQNRAFLDNAQNPVHWSVVQPNGATATMALDKSQPLTEALPVSFARRSH